MRRELLFGLTEGFVYTAVFAGEIVGAGEPMYRGVRARMGVTQQASSSRDPRSRMCSCAPVPSSRVLWSREADGIERCAGARPALMGSAARCWMTCVNSCASKLRLPAAVPGADIAPVQRRGPARPCMLERTHS